MHVKGTEVWADQSCCKALYRCAMLCAALCTEYGACSAALHTGYCVATCSALFEQFGTVD
jgi:hypothetical protein